MTYYGGGLSRELEVKLNVGACMTYYGGGLSRELEVKLNVGT